MTCNPFSWSAGCLCILLSALLILCIPATAVELDPIGAGSPNTVTIANGDPVLIHGIATGQPRTGLQLWIISHNYLKVTTIPVNNDDTYLYELKPADTRNLAPGQYFFLVQHPMMNGQFDVVYNPSSGTIVNRQLGEGGLNIFTISGGGSLQGPDSAQALVRAVSSQNIDDTFATFSFFIAPPVALIDTIGDRHAGDRFTISGSTNLAAGDDLMVEIYSSSFRPTTKEQSGEFSGLSRVVKVTEGSGGYNRWAIEVDAASFKPDEYIVKVSGITLDVTGSAYFNVLPGTPTVPVTTTTPVPVTTVLPVTTSPLPTTLPTPQSPLPAGIGFGAVAAVICLKKFFS